MVLRQKVYLLFHKQKMFIQKVRKNGWGISCRMHQLFIRTYWSRYKISRKKLYKRKGWGSLQNSLVIPPKILEVYNSRGKGSFLQNFELYLHGYYQRYKIVRKKLQNIGGGVSYRFHRLLLQKYSMYKITGGRFLRKSLLIPTKIILEL